MGWGSRVPRRNPYFDKSVRTVLIKSTCSVHAEPVEAWTEEIFQAALKLNRHTGMERRFQQVAGCLWPALCSGFVLIRLLMPYAARVPDLARITANPCQQRASTYGLNIALARAIHQKTLIFCIVPAGSKTLKQTPFSRAEKLGSARNIFLRTRGLLALVRKQTGKPICSR